jgi:hypothetical protein
VEPVRSLLSRRTEGGVDLYSEGTPPPHEELREGEGAGAHVDDEDAEHWRRERDPLRRFWERYGRQLNGNASHFDELFDRDLGEYKVSPPPPLRVARRAAR